jgi:hypothetical protein
MGTTMSNLVNLLFGEFIQTHTMQNPTWLNGPEMLQFWENFLKDSVFQMILITNYTRKMSFNVT